MLVLVGNFSYTSRVNFSEESLLHAQVSLSGSFSYTSRASFSGKFYLTRPVLVSHNIYASH